jgi:hypothetical protein
MQSFGFIHRMKIKRNKIARVNRAAHSNINPIVERRKKVGFVNWTKL